MLARSLLSTICFLFALSALAQPRAYHPEETRELLLQLKNFRPSKLRLTGHPRSDQEKAFADYYKEVIRPVEDSLTLPSMNYAAYVLLLDSGSYRDQTELQAWREELFRAQEVFNALSVDRSWTKKLRTWKNLAEGLEGELPEMARKSWRDRTRFSYAPEMKNKLDELAKLEREFDDAINQAKAADYLTQSNKEVQDAVKAFKDNQIDFKKASEIIRRNTEMYGYRFVGYEAQQALPDHLNRMAVIRSELARSKGYRTWAEFILSGDEGYSETYRGIESQRNLLINFIDQLAPAVDKALRQRIVSLGLSGEDLRVEYSSLLFPEGLGKIRDHFPPSALTTLWAETMLESGFSSETLQQILIDDKTRPQKNSTGAYNFGVIQPSLKVETLDLNTLNFVKAKPTSPRWRKGFSYILQSYKTGGIQDLETMFHEGGHALEGLLKYKIVPTPEANAYVETPSTTMEHFLNDPDFVFAKAFPVDGKKPSIDEVQRLLGNARLSEAAVLLSTVHNALFDIDLWNYDYSAPNADTFMQRVRSLSDRNPGYVLGLPAVDSPVPSYYGMISTSHFTNGSVRYMGYVFADLSSRQMAQFISDELEKQTGRRSWLQQPLLAELFARRFFAQGWKRQFPQNIESITRRNFDPQKILRRVLSEFRDCSSLLKDK